MARYELDDGGVRRFWEVELAGDALRYRAGELGTAGRAYVRSYGTERLAQDTFDNAVRAMVNQGYVQVLTPAEPPPAGGPGWQALLDDPDDHGALAVQADWLQGQGDVRGELIALELAASADPALGAQVAAFRAAHLEDLAGPVQGFPGELALEWAWGWVRSARFEASNPRGTDPEGRAVALLAHPGFQLLRSLVLYIPASLQVIGASHLPALRELTLHAGVVSSTWTPSVRLDLDALGRAAPRLRSLVVRGSPGRVAGNAVLAGLTRLDVRCSSDWTSPLVQGAAPVLQDLCYHGVDVPTLLALASAGVLAPLRTLTLTPGWDTSIERLARAVGMGLARRSGDRGLHLRLHGVEIDVRAARRLAALPLGALTVDGELDPEASAVLSGAGFPVDGRLRVVRKEDPDAEPVRPKDLAVIRLEYLEGPRHWFWEVGVDGAVHHVRHGRLGTRGTWVWNRFPSEDVAEEVLERRVEEKLREGYTRTEARVLVP